MGGLIGNDDMGIIEKSFATGNVYTPATSAGGFIGGASKTTIKKSFSTGNVKAEDIAGGFAGFLKDNTPSGQTYIEDCYSIGNAIATDGHDLKNGGFIGALEGGNVKK